MKPLLATLLLIGCAACGTSRSYRSSPGPYDVLPPAERVPLRGARQALESSDFVRAAAYLEPVAARHSRNLGVRAFLQDLELAQLQAGLALDEIEPLVDPSDAERVLRERYVERARSSASPELWILAGRLEDDGGRALDYLERAEALDPTCVWVHYARAWWSFRLRRFQDARAAMDAGLELDPGHQPSLRLLAHMLAGAGDGPEAIRVLGLWLDRAGSDPLVSSAQRVESLLDLALLWVLDNEPKRALGLLEQIDTLDPERRHLPKVARLELVRAAAYDLRGEWELAFAACRRAAEADPGILLPLVDEALLVQRRQPGSDAERDAWERVLAEASSTRETETPVDFDSLLLQLMARAHLSRLEAQEPKFMGMFAASEGQENP